MLKKDWKKNLLRVKQMADQNLGRAEKSEVLTENLVQLEKRVELIRQICQGTSKKLGACLQGQGQDIEKRLKKLPETGMSHVAIESATLLGTDTSLGAVFQYAGESQGSLAKELLQYEMEVDQNVLMPMQSLLENEIPSINKLRKHLTKLTLDMDSARNRWQVAVRGAQATGSNMASAAAKADQIREEMEEASGRVEMCKDQLSTEMFNFVAKETDYSHWLLTLVKAQAEYHRKALSELENVIPKIQAELEKTPQRAVYGCPLEEHLKTAEREIAFVIEECVCTLMEIGLDEEGLFRIAGSNSKVKKLKGAFDAGMLDMNEFVIDVHCIAGALKQYLRELPEPLLTYPLYEEWMAAAHLPPDQRLQALWVVTDKLPKMNYDNLRYLIKFLAKLAENQELNKMSPSNIAIVMAPNLIWSDDDAGPSVLSTGVQSAILDSFISHADWFFPGEIVFTPTESGSSTPPGTLSHNTPVVNAGDTGNHHSPQNSLSITSQGDNLLGSPSHSPKIGRRASKKPAPRPPGPAVAEKPVISEKPAMAEKPTIQEKPSHGDRHSSSAETSPEAPEVMVTPPESGLTGLLIQIHGDPPPIPARPSLDHPITPPPDRPYQSPPSPSFAPDKPLPPPPVSERPYGQPPERPHGPPPARPADKPPAPPPPNRTGSSFQRQGSGRPARPQPPPPPPPKSADEAPLAAEEFTHL